MHMTRSIGIAAVLSLSALGACSRDAPPSESAPPAIGATVDTAAVAAPDSLVIDVAQPTLIGFHPFASDSMLERDEELATVLDDFGHHLSGAMRSLRDSGWVVDTRIADTLHFRAGDRSWRWIRPPDSAYVGYVLTDASGRLRSIYGVRTDFDLIVAADSFLRTPRR